MIQIFFFFLNPYNTFFDESDETDWKEKKPLEHWECEKKEKILLTRGDKTNISPSSLTFR